MLPDPGEVGELCELAWLHAAALAHAACRAAFSVRCFRLPLLVEEFARYAAIQRRSALLKQLARVELLVIDDFGLAPLAETTVRDLLEDLDYRYDRASTLITSQLPVEARLPRRPHCRRCHPGPARAIANMIALKGDSMRNLSAANRNDR